MTKIKLESCFIFTQIGKKVRVKIKKKRYAHTKNNQNRKKGSIENKTKIKIQVTRKESKMISCRPLIYVNKIDI